MVRAQALQFLPEELLHGVPAADQVMGELGGDVHLIPEATLLQDLAQGRLAAGVDIGGVEIVDAALDGGQDLPFRLGHVDLAQLAGEAHTAEAQDGELISVSVGAVLHR